MSSSSWRPGGRPGARLVDEFKEGDSVKGVVKAVNDFGVFLDIGTSKDALLPWAQVDGSGPGAGETLSLLVARVDIERQRITLSAPSSRGGVGSGVAGRTRASVASRSPSRSRATAGASGGKEDNKTPVGGFIHDVMLGVRVRRKGGKGDGRGLYSYADGMPFTDLMAEDDVSGHVTNIEKEGCWVDIGATKDGFLRWENAPRNASRWQVGDMLDDLKIISVHEPQIMLKWDDEGIGSLTEKDWEKLFAQGPPVPPLQKDIDSGPPTGENCCAMYGSTGVVRSGDVTEDGDAKEQDRRVVENKVAERRVEDFGKAGKGKGDKGWAAEGKGRGKDKNWEPGHKGSDDFAKGKSKGWKGEGMNEAKGGKGKMGEDTLNGKDTGKGWGKCEGPAYDGVGDYGSCIAPPEVRARSAPPPALKRLRPLDDLAVGEIVRGRVTSLSRAGVLVDFGCEVEGLIPRALVTLQCKKGEVIPKLNIMGVDTNLGKVTLEPLEDDEPVQA